MASILNPTQSRAVPNGRRLELRQNESVSVAAARGTIVRCTQGRLWLTQEGHWRDYVLIAGTGYLSPDDGKIVLNSPDGPSTASISRTDRILIDDIHAVHLQFDADSIEQMEREARRVQAAEIFRWTQSLVEVLSKAWRSVAGRRGSGNRKASRP